MAQRHIVAGSAGLTAGRNAPAGYATDDGVAIHHRGTEVEEAISQTPGALAHGVFKSASGGVVEQPLTPRLLPSC
jgi:hypothetical protein